MGSSAADSAGTRPPRSERDLVFLAFPEPPGAGDREATSPARPDAAACFLIPALSPEPYRLDGEQVVTGPGTADGIPMVKRSASPAEHMIQPCHGWPPMMPPC